MENYSIRFVSDDGWRKYPNQKAPLTGVPLEKKSLKEILDYCTTLPDDGVKGTHGAIFTYDKTEVGNASIEYYHQTRYDGVIFVDIDHIPSTVVDDIFEKFDEICLASANAIIACQKSSSYFRRRGTNDTGIHFFIASEVGDGYDYLKYSAYALAITAAVVAKVVGVDVRNYGGGEKVLDTSSCKISQRSFLYYSDYRYSETVIPITPEAYDLNIEPVKQHYPELFRFTTEEFEAVDLSGTKVSGKVEGKIQLDYSKECIVSNFLSAVGWEPGRILQTLLDIDSRDRQEYFRKHNQSLEKHFKQIIRTSQSHKNLSERQKDIAVRLLLGCGVSVEERRIESFVKQEENRITRIEMEDDKFMSDYVDKVEKFIAKEQVLTISAPTGTGKTTMLEKLTKKYHKKAIILVPFNVTNQLYRWSNVVSSMSTNKFLPGRINTMIWDQFIKNYKEIEQSSDIIFVDESHTLFLDRSYRDSAVGVWAKFQTWIQLGKKIVFVSATPAGEIAKLNSRVLKFIKNDKRNVKVNILSTNDTLTALEQDLHNTEYDRVCVFSDRDVKILYARLCAKGEQDDSKIYHSQWSKNVEELKTTEKLTARMNLLTCIAFNGLNIKNAGENICVSVRYTEGVTTLNELIQIVGRFRDNKNITLNIYVDNKYATFENLDELFANAKTITDYESNEELKSEYYERLASGSVQDSLREIDAYEKMWTLGNIIREMKSRYPIEVVNKVFSKAHLVKRANPIKRKASDLFVDFLSGKIDEETFSGQYVNTDMENFINGWRHEMNNIVWQVGEKVGIVDVIVAECEKQNTLIDNAIKKIKHIIWIVGMGESRWNEEVANRAGLKSLLKGATMIKRAMTQFKKDDEIRVKYAEYIYSDRDVSEILSFDSVDIMFEVVSKEVKQAKVIKSECQKGKHSKAHKQHKLYVYKCVETGVSKTKPEWMEETGCTLNRFDYLVRKGLYVKE